MRWRNDDEKALVLEAAAEYGKRLSDFVDLFPMQHPTVAHFEEWLRWYFAEGLHTQSVSAYMSGGNHKPSAYVQPVATQATPPTTTKQPGTLAWGGLLEALSDKKLSKPQYIACIRAYEKNVGDSRGRPLVKLLEGIEGDYVRGEILKAVNSA